MTTMRNKEIILPLVIAVLLVSCDRDETTQSITQSAAQQSTDEYAAGVKSLDVDQGKNNHYALEEEDGEKNEQINWLKGDVESAFAQAKAQGRPVFLYWGAEWCPPCQQLKATVFKEPVFIAKTRQFMPVYLDGDTENAQRLGERFGVKGYPTLIVLNSEGAEITRIAGGLNAERFSGALDAVLNSVQPVQVVLQRVLDNPDSATESDYKLLAYYSWGQDTQDVMPEGREVEVFEQLMQQVPSGLEAIRARFFVAYLEAAAKIDPSGELYLDDADSRQDVIKQMISLLENESIRAEVSESIISSSKEIVGFLASQNFEDRQALITAWSQAAQAFMNDNALSTAERLGALMPLIVFAVNHEGAVSETLKQTIREQVRKADELTKDPGERQTVMSRATYIMMKADMIDEARSLLEAEIDKALKPFYFMLRLSRLEKRAGNIEKAVAWLERAYNEADGRATRFQWGVNYINGLIEMTPQDVVRIEAVTKEVLSEHLQYDDALYGRNRKRMTELGDALIKWGQVNHGKALENIRNTVSRRCQKLEVSEACELFLRGV